MTRLAALLTSLALLVAACGATDTDAGESDDSAVSTTTTSQATTTTTQATTTTTAVGAAATVAVAESDLGTILVDGDGKTLYLFTPDNQGDSVCYDQCAVAWPPLTGTVEAGDGIDGSLLGSAARDDGPAQVTYNGWPLYYFANDAAPGDTNGQGINDVWYVVDGAGNGIGLPTTLSLAASDLGTIMVDGDGRTLYLFTPDNQGESTCYDQCAEAWPPLTRTALAGEGIDQALLGTAPRTDGSAQVTYNGWPLYYFANDAAPGDTNGQGINDVWFVVDGAGNGIGLGG